MDSVEVITSFKEELARGGLTPRDVSPLMGLSHTTMYRIMCGRASTSSGLLRSMQMFTKFLRTRETPISPDLSSLGLNEHFERWVSQ